MQHKEVSKISEVEIARKRLFTALFRLENAIEKRIIRDSHNQEIVKKVQTDLDYYVNMFEKIMEKFKND